MEHVSEQFLDSRIAKAEMAVMVQIVEIDKLRVAGQSTDIAERTLLAFVGSLQAMRDYRNLIAQKKSATVNPIPAASWHLPSTEIR